ncbi:MAG: hypothetical protein AB7Y74_09705 [Syntrophorhabdus sp.]
MAYPFEKMTTRKLRSKLHEKYKRDRCGGDRSDRKESNPTRIKSRRTNPTHCQTNENPTSR